jgi:16S rRNA (guanine527-N7)-methyltransferase
MKGKHPQDEIANLPAVFHVDDVIPLHIEGVSVERHLIRITSN